MSRSEKQHNLLSGSETKSGRETGARQLPLDLPPATSLAREDLIVTSANQLASDLVDHWPDWPSHMVILAGPEGSGKSHLAGIWAQKADAVIYNAKQIHEDMALPEADASLVIENVDSLPNSSPAINEQALFHLFNHTRSGGGYILITSRTVPAAWGLKLPDLISRLKTAHIAELSEPDDLLLSAVITKLFADRQMEVSPAIIAYLVQRMERSLDAAGALVAWLDHEALSRNSRVNHRLAEEAIRVLQRG